MKIFIEPVPAATESSIQEPKSDVGNQEAEKPSERPPPVQENESQPPQEEEGLEDGLTEDEKGTLGLVLLVNWLRDFALCENFLPASSSSHFISH